MWIDETVGPTCDGKGDSLRTKQRRGVCLRLCEVTGAVSQGRKRWGEEAGISV